MIKKQMVALILIVVVLLLAGCSPTVPSSGQNTPVPTVPPVVQPTETTATHQTIEITPTQAEVQSSPVPTSGDVSPGAIQHFSPGSSFSFSSIDMQDKLNGWAIGGEVQGALGDHILSTADGGFTWRDVTPPEPAEPSQARDKVAIAGFLDAQHAWATYFYVPTAENGIKVPEAPVVWRTVDGGLTWQASQPLSFGSGNPADYRVSSIQFADAENGWLQAHVGGMNPNGLVLFHSRDGGATWERLLDPSSLYLQDCGNIHVYFQDASNGWATGSCEGKPGAYLMRTSDAGSTWQPVELPEPADAPGVLQTSFCMTQSLHFVTPQDGFLSAGCGNNAGFQALLWSTQDGGQSWQASRLPVGGALGFATPQKGWLLAQSPNGPDTNLYTTQNGGATWTQATTLSFNTATPLEVINFVDEQNGFLVTVGVENGTLAYTNDGGVSWKVVPTPEIVE